VDELFGGQYVRGDSLGGGSQGQVFAGRARDSDQAVAVKILSLPRMNSPRALDQFRQEQEVLASLSHPNLVHVLDFVSEGDRVAIVMDYVHGEDLRKYLQHEGTLRPAEAATLASQILRGAAAIHEAGIVHRDIKPENILLDTSTDRIAVKLTDLGIARRFERPPALTITGGLQGTPYYMAPEAIQGASPAPPADVYSVGVVLYEMLAGRQPFSGSEFSVLNQQLTQRARTIPELNPLLWAVLETMLAKDPNARPAAPEAADVLTALATALDQEPALQPMAAGTRPIAPVTSPSTAVPAWPATPRPSGVPGPGYPWPPQFGPVQSASATETRHRTQTAFPRPAPRPDYPTAPVIPIGDRRDARKLSSMSVQRELREEQVARAGGIVRRFEVGDHEFLIIDRTKDAVTLNWSSRITPSEFAAIVAEQLDAEDTDGRATLSLSGVINDVAPEFALAVALMDTGSFDKDCDFLRFDIAGISVAYQVMPHKHRDEVCIFGVSARDLDVGTVFPLLVMSGTEQVLAHALKVGPRSLSGRLTAVLAESAGTDDRPRQKESK
jgi:serine/threonine protein kinase